MAEFVLLGAGFSRAIHDAMPLLPNLAEQVLADLGESPATLSPFEGNLEQWLSYLSIDQPWLTDAANLRNRALFYEASEAVRRCINQAEGQVDCPPPWLERLVHDWCAGESFVASFNYDLLVERTTSTLGLVSTWLDLYGLPLEVRPAPSRGLSYGYRSPPGPAYTLLKLHGSVNWAYGGLDAPPSERVVLTHEDVWWQRPGTQLSAEAMTPDQSRYQDLQPLIVPPTGTKGPYYTNRSLRGQWRQAFSALQSATAVTVIGYSFPVSDLVTRHLFATASITCPITVVDRSEGALDTVRRLAPHAPVSAYGGDNAVSDFVDTTCGDLVSTRALYDPSGYQPQLLINGRAEPLDVPDGAYDPSLTDEHSRSVMQWVDRVAKDRFPVLNERRRYPARRGEPGENAWLDTYTGRPKAE